jgi:hypothetical protein
MITKELTPSELQIFMLKVLRERFPGLDAEVWVDEAHAGKWWILNCRIPEGFDRENNIGKDKKRFTRRDLPGLMRSIEYVVASRCNRFDGIAQCRTRDFSIAVSVPCGKQLVYELWIPVGEKTVKDFTRFSQSEPAVGASF